MLFGANGFLGRVISCLVQEEESLETIRVSGKEGKYEIRFKSRRLFARDFQEIEAILGKVGGAKYFINAAASTVKSSSYSDIKRLIAANVTLLAQMGQLASSLAIERLVTFGTYSSSIDGTGYSPQTAYAATKVAGVEIADFFSATAGFQLVVLEPYDIYSADHPHGKIVTRVVQSIRDDEELAMSLGHQELAPIHALDVARAALTSLRVTCSARVERWSLPGPQTMTLREICAEIADSMGYPERLKLFDFSHPYRDREIMMVNPTNPIFPLGEMITLRRGIFMNAIQCPTTTENTG